jgi:hypothetical protein
MLFYPRPHFPPINSGTPCHPRWLEQNLVCLTPRMPIFSPPLDLSKATADSVHVALKFVLVCASSIFSAHGNHDQTPQTPFRTPWFRLRLCARFVALKTPAPAQDSRFNLCALDPQDLLAPKAPHATKLRDALRSTKGRSITPAKFRHGRKRTNRHSQKPIDRRKNSPFAFPCLSCGLLFEGQAGCQSRERSPHA